MYKIVISNAFLSEIFGAGVFGLYEVVWLPSPPFLLHFDKEFTDVEFLGLH